MKEENIIFHPKPIKEYEFTILKDDKIISQYKLLDVNYSIKEIPKGINISEKEITFYKTRCEPVLTTSVKSDEKFTIVLKNSVEKIK